MIKLRLRNFLARDEAYYIGRTYLPQSSPPPHTHDFAEVFWIESGEGLHLINGGRDALQTGDVVWIEPSDAHGFQGDIVLVNLAFEAAVLDWLRREYGPVRKTNRLSAGRLACLRPMADALAVSTKNRLTRDSFLLQLMEMTVAEDCVDTAMQKLPGWLRHAVGEFGQPKYMPGGTPGFARLAGRSAEHVNRVLRTTLGKTTTDVVNEIRLDYAARHLRMTDQKITEIALDCGIGNLGHFYLLFQKRFAMTPRKYRLRQQSLVR